jgi:hypothetical protein
MREDPKMENLAKSIEKPSHSTWSSYRKCSLVKDWPVPLNRFLLDSDIKQMMYELTGKQPAEWGEVERGLAYHNSVVPGSIM